MGTGYICNFVMCVLDIMSQLELGKPEERRKPQKRVNGIFWIILLNLGIYAADHVLQVVIYSFWFYEYIFLCLMRTEIFRRNICTCYMLVLYCNILVSSGRQADTRISMLVVRFVQ